MADEIIEKYLRDKLDHAITEIEQPEYYHPPKLQNLKELLHPSPQPAEQNLQKLSRVRLYCLDNLKKLLHPSPQPAEENLEKLTRARLYSLDNLLTEWQMHSKKQTFFSCRSFGSHCNFANSYKRIMEETPKKENGSSTARHGAQPTPQGAEGSSTAPNGQTRQPSSHDPASSARKEEAFRWSTRLVDTEKIHGLEDKIKSLQRLLVPREDDDAEFKTIGIVGMRGIGKTALCQVIFDKKEVRKHYLPRIWVCMSKQPGENKEPRKEIVKRMLECLGVEIITAADDIHELKKLLFALRLQLVGKRYLIVLDDVWSTAEQYKDFCSSLDQEEKCSEKLAYGLPKGCGGAIIVTSRSEEVAAAMVGEDNLYRLPPLSEESCWKIFKDSFEEDGKLLSQALENLESKIKEKCAGLPLAAKMMGQIAREQPAAPASGQAESQQEEQQAN